MPPNPTPKESPETKHIQPIQPIVNMKTVTAVLVAMVGLVSAAPNTDAILSTRQSCVYSCGCQTDGSGGVDPDTALCCASVGGVLENEDTVRSFVVLDLPMSLEGRRTDNQGKQLCGEIDLTKAQAYAACCGPSGGYVCFQSDRSCPPVVVN